MSCPRVPLQLLRESDNLRERLGERERGGVEVKVINRRICRRKLTKKLPKNSKKKHECVSTTIASSI